MEEAVAKFTLSVYYRAEGSPFFSVLC